MNYKRVNIFLSVLLILFFVTSFTSCIRANKIVENEELHDEIMQITLMDHVSINDIIEHVKYKNVEYSILSKAIYTTSKYFIKENYDLMNQNDNIFLIVTHISQKRLFLSIKEVQHLTSIIFDINGEINWVMYNQIDS